MYRLTFLKNLRQTLILILISTFILGIARIVFLLNITTLHEVLQYTHDFWLSTVVGLRFDLKVSIIAFMPLFLAGSITAIKEKWQRRFQSFSLYYTSLIVFLWVAFSIGNYYFYKTYGNFFDVFMFGFFDDDTQAVALSMWQDYPVLRAVAFAIIISYISVIAIQRHQQLTQRPSDKIPSKLRVGMTAFISVLVFFILARGALGSFPLGRYDANISSFIPLNKVTPNAFMAMDWARKDYLKEENLPPVDKTALEAQMKKVIGQDTPVYRTSKNNYLAENKPNVFLVLMESMGTNYLVDDDEKNNDLLGSLRSQFNDDFTFKRFQAGTSGTWTSIMMMLTQSNHSTISQSSYKKIKLDSLATIPYKKAGYEVSFIYAGDSGWRNSGEYLRHQGFDHFYDEAAILAKYPEAKKTKSEWGLADEYAFKFAQYVLETAKKPQMIFMMSITNHPPYTLPSTYQAKPVHLTQRLKDNIANSQSEALMAEKTYQYASNSLGDFIHEIKHSNLGSKTIIAASGDHHMRNINLGLKNEYAISYAVPFYLHIPKNILEHVTYKYDRNRIGSHRDIFPTLYHFSLSDSDYITLGGQNLLSTQTVDNIGYNETHLVTSDGAYSKTRPQDLYYWDKDLIHTKEIPVNNPKPHFLNDYTKLQDMYIRSLLNKDK
ncbi:sulfatase-like hydrolase/transferase [Vibrio sp. S11_S32]|uniref:LTA synthase family protein n=1 Tax=Vibrio sp. S11_S32 TaxID=2720225 RepID=UPI001680BC81|nr:alkaline phosphatase family protein [Vibrio sp. S11_S32]MBD1576846.1 sulfatase-like hydrolase/transferase [Vibrio sp. S11_S32]